MNHRIKFTQSPDLDTQSLSKFYDNHERGFGIPDLPLSNPMQRITIRNLWERTAEEKDADDAIEMNKCNIKISQDGTINIADGDIITDFVYSYSGHMVAVDRVW